MKTRFAALAFSVLALTACGAEEVPETDGPEYGTTEVFTVTVDGRDVTCVAWAEYRKGGLSCDWGSAE